MITEWNIHCTMYGIVTMCHYLFIQQSILCYANKMTTLSQEKKIKMHTKKSEHTQCPIAVFDEHRNSVWIMRQKVLLNTVAIKKYALATENYQKKTK